MSRRMVTIVSATVTFFALFAVYYNVVKHQNRTSNEVVDLRDNSLPKIEQAVVNLKAGQDGMSKKLDDMAEKMRRPSSTRPARASRSSRATPADPSVEDLLEQLRVALTANDSDVIRDIRRSILRSGEDAVPRLVTALGDRDELVAKEAAKLLLSIGEPAVHALVWRGLNSSNAEAVRLAKIVLVQIGEASKACLREALDGRWPKIRTEAQNVLQKLGDGATLVPAAAPTATPTSSTSSAPATSSVATDADEEVLAADTQTLAEIQVQLRATARALEVAKGEATALARTFHRVHFKSAGEETLRKKLSVKWLEKRLAELRAAAESLAEEAKTKPATAL